MNVWFKFVSLLLCTSSTCIEYTGATLREKRRFELHGERQTYSGAVEACQSLPGGAWGLPDFQQYQDQLVSYIQHTTSMSSPVWLSWRRITLQNWTWTDGSLLQNELKSKAGSDCAGLALEVTGIRVMDCTERHIGFVCQVARQVHDYTCPELYFPHACINTGGSWYVIGCGSQNWQDARTYCTRLGGDLAVLDSPDKQQLVLQYLTEKKLLDECSWLYLGLRKEDWVKKQHNNVTVYADSVYWGRREPEFSNRHCSKLVLSSRPAIWKATHCQDRLHVICQNYANWNYHNLPDVKPSLHRMTTRASLNVPVTAAFCVVIAILLIVMAVTLGIYWKKRKKLNPKSKIKISVVNVPTILIFSSGISTHPSNTIVEEIKWPNWTESGSSDGRYMAKLAVNLFMWAKKIIPARKPPASKIIRIININLVDKDGKIPEAQVIPLLEFLQKHAKHIDVILLPDFSRRLAEPSDAIRCLWSIRKQTVVITSSKQMLDVPASDVISVGVTSTYEESHKNYVTDIDVKIPRGYEGDKQVDTSVYCVSVAAVIAQIKHAFTTEISNLADSEITRGQTHIFKRILLHLCAECNVRGVHQTVGHPVLDLDQVQISKKSIQNIISTVGDEMKIDIPMVEENNNPDVRSSNFNYECLIENYKLNICIINRGFNHENINMTDWSVSTSELGNLNTSLDDKLLEHLITELTQSSVPINVLQKVVKFKCFNIIDEDYRVSWVTLSKVFEEIIEDKYDIVLMPALSDRPPPASVVVKQAMALAAKCVFICPAGATRINFPGEIAITVEGTKEHNEIWNNGIYDIMADTQNLLPFQNVHGSLLDFKCQIHVLPGDIMSTSDYMRAAPNYLCAVIIDLLVQAELSDLSQDHKEKIRSSHAMHELIKYVIFEQNRPAVSSFGTLNHNICDGWGIIKHSTRICLPLPLIVPKILSLPHYTWNGKNV